MFKLISVDNKESKGCEKIGFVDHFYFHGTFFEFHNIRSSRVEMINRIDDELIVKTKNSTYVFEKQ